MCEGCDDCNCEVESRSKEVKIIEDLKSELCLKCLYCCEWVYIPMRMDDGVANFYGRVRGIDIRWDRMFRPWAIVWCPCQHLSEAGCGVYKDRPADCRMYDGRNDPFYPEKCKWSELPVVDYIEKEG